jgi:hypothetical protein
MDYPFQAEGKIIYDPTAGKAANAWWVIVECPKDIMDYYHHWAKKENETILNKPLFGSHISVVRGEEPPDSLKPQWRKHHEEAVTFHYSHEIFSSGEYYWLEVACPRLEELRTELGLTANPEFGFHLTIGRKIGEGAK